MRTEGGRKICLLNHLHFSRVAASDGVYWTRYVFRRQVIKYWLVWSKESGWLPGENIVYNAGWWLRTQKTSAFYTSCRRDHFQTFAGTGQLHLTSQFSALSFKRNCSISYLGVLHYSLRHKKKALQKEGFFFIFIAKCKAQASCSFIHFRSTFFPWWGHGGNKITPDISILCHKLQHLLGGCPDVPKATERYNLSSGYWGCSEDSVKWSMSDAALARADPVASTLTLKDCSEAQMYSWASYTIM